MVARRLRTSAVEGKKGGDRGDVRPGGESRDLDSRPGGPRQLDVDATRRTSGARAVGAADERERTGEAPGGDPGLEPDRSVRSRADAPSQPGCTPDWSTCPRRRDPLFRNDARAGARARRPPTGASANGGGGRATRRCRVGRATRARLARGRLMSAPKDALLRFVPRGRYVPRGF